MPEEDARTIDNATAAVIVEPIQGMAGALDLDADFLKAIRERCRVQRRYLPALVGDGFLDGGPAVIEAEEGGATVIVLNVERFEQL